VTSSSSIVFPLQKLRQDKDRELDTLKVQATEDRKKRKKIRSCFAELYRHIAT
jgi:hypothetical protein